MNEEIEERSNICKICNITSVKYTCPKCNISFCSVNCYKNEKHMQCSESFYRNCVITELQSIEPDNNSKKNMYETLARIQQQQSDDVHLIDNNHSSDLDSDDDDDDFTADIQERFANVDLDNPDEIWNKLSNDERQEFEGLIQSGQIHELVPKWTPWWCLQTYTTPIEELDQAEADVTYKQRCPSIKDMPDFSVVSTKTPSECIKYNIVNVLGSYAYTLRIYNGEHYDNLDESVYLLTFLSNNMKCGKNYNSFEDAVNDIIPETMNCSLVCYDEHFFDEVRTDCELLVKGPTLSDQSYYVKAALSDIHEMLSLKKNKKSSRSKQISKNSEFYRKFVDPKIPTEIPRDKLKLYIKKIEYYLSYVKSYNLQCLKS